MKSDKELLHEKITTYKLSGMLFAIGAGFLYLIIALPDIGDYPLVRIAGGLIGVFALVSGIGVWRKRNWTKWTLLMLLFSTYLVFGATHLVKGETSNFIIGFAIVGLPVVAYFFWRSVRKVLGDAS